MAEITCNKCGYMEDIPEYVEIADNQELPNVRNAVNKSYNDYMLGQEDMIKEGWIKCKK